MKERYAAQNTLKSSVEEKTVERLFFENRLLGYREAAEMLCVSERHLRSLKTLGKIKYVPIGDGERGVRFRVSSLLKFIEKREVSA